MSAIEVLAQHTTSDYTKFECHCPDRFWGTAEEWSAHVIEALARAGHHLTQGGMIR